MITFEGPQYMWTNPSQKSRQGSDPPSPHPGNACILGVSGPATHPLIYMAAAVVLTIRTECASVGSTFNHDQMLDLSGTLVFILV